MKRFTGKRVVVTGGSLGIGRAAVDAFLDEGAAVITVARHRNTDMDGLVGRESRFSFFSADLSRADETDVFAASVLAPGPIDVLVNNVGGGPPTVGRTGFLDVADHEWIDTFTLNVMSAIRMCSAVLPSMLAVGRGAILNVGSMRSVVPKQRSPDYSIAKAALNTLTVLLADEFGPAGIRVNTVLPGAIRTPMWEQPRGALDVLRQDAGGTDDELYRTIPQSLRLALPRVGTAEEVAKVIVFLASDEASYVAGITLPVAGGMR